MPRLRDLDEQRQRISEAAWLELAERGPVSFTLRGVAERAGCTTGLVLHTFADKRELLLHARDRLYRRARERADAAESAARDPRAALEAVLLQSLALDEDGAREARVWFGFLAAALGDPELADRHRAGNRAFVERVRRLVAAADPTASPAESRTRALVLVGAVEGLTTLSSADGEVYSPRAQRAVVTALLGAVLGAVETAS